MNLKIWCDGSPNAPIVVVIPGFLNETDISNPLKGWDEPILQFCSENMFSAGGLYWDSKSFTKNEVNSLSLHKLQNGILDTWRAARKEADRISKKLDEILNVVDRPIILVGHSLGGRIALQYASRKGIKPLRSVYALAPAVSRSEIDLETIEENVEKSVILGYSKRDLVLQCLYPIGRNKSTFSQLVKSLKKRDIKALRYISKLVSNHIDSPPIGCVGTNLVNLKKTELREFEISHTQYCSELYNILNEVKENI